MKKILLVCFVSITLFAASCEEILDDSYFALRGFLNMSEKRIPAKLLRKAQAIAIIPHVIRGGFIVGGRYGEGILMVKNQGVWSDPVFVTLAGGSFGWQIGLESIDVMLIFKSKERIRNLLGGKFTLGADASIAAGPVGRAGEASTDIRFRSEIYSYSKSRGIFAGVALKGAVLDIDYDKTKECYGALPVEVLSGVRSKNLTIAKIKALLQKY